MKIEIGQSYHIEEDGAPREARVDDRPKDPDRPKATAKVVYVSRARRPGEQYGRGRFTQRPTILTLSEFKKLLVPEA